MRASAAATLRRPISKGRCATLADIRPSMIACTASAVASNPTTTMPAFGDLAMIASTAPSAIWSLVANTALMSGCAVRMFSMTVSPSDRSLLAGWRVTTCRPGTVAIVSRKPAARSSCD